MVLQCIGLAFTPASRQLMPVGVMAASRSASALQVESSDAPRTSTICCFLTAAAGAGDRFARASGLPARPPNHQLPPGATLALRLAAQPSSPCLCIIQTRRSTDRVVTDDTPVEICGWLKGRWVP